MPRELQRTQPGKGNVPAAAPSRASMAQSMIPISLRMIRIGESPLRPRNITQPSLCMRRPSCEA